MFINFSFYAFLLRKRCPLACPIVLSFTWCLPCYSSVLVLVLLLSTHHVSSLVILAFRLCCFTLCRLNSLCFSHLLSGAGCGIRLYRFLIIAFSFILQFKFLYRLILGWMYNLILSVSDHCLFSTWCASDVVTDILVLRVTGMERMCYVVVTHHGHLH